MSKVPYYIESDDKMRLMPTELNTPDILTISDERGEPIFIIDRKGKIDIPEGVEIGYAARTVLTGLGILISMAHETGYHEGYQKAMRDVIGEKK